MPARLEIQRLSLALVELEQSFSLRSLECQRLLRALEGPGSPARPVRVPDADTPRVLRGELASLFRPATRTLRAWVGMLARFDLQTPSGDRLAKLDAEGPLMRRLLALRDADQWDDPTELANLVRDFSDRC